MQIDKYIVRQLQSFLIPSGMALLLTACTQADIVRVQEAVAKGRVQIYPDKSKYTLPALEYHFYNLHTEQEYIIRPSDGTGNFNDTLSVGTYRVIATNTDAAHVEFIGMDSYETAIVRSLSLGTRPSLSRADYTMLNQPDNVYSTVVETLVVTRNDTIRVTPVPVLLTKQLNLEFSMEDELNAEVKEMTGVLPGVYPAVHLYTHEGTYIEQSPNMAVNFETVVEGEGRKAEIFLFGVRDPASGEGYTNNMELQFEMKNGTTSTATLDMTDVISNIISNNDGDIPSQVSIPVTITKTGEGEETEIKVTVDVDSWIVEGETEEEAEA